jgi:hypothetical protein
VGIIPCGGHIRLQGMDDPAGKYGNVPLFGRLALRLNGSLATLLLAGFLLGPRPAASSLVNGIGQVFAGAYAPISIGAGLAAQIVGLIGNGHLLEALGVLASKLAALNLLAATVPVGLELTNAYPELDRRDMAILMLHTLWQGFVWLGWAVALCAWLFS